MNLLKSLLPIAAMAGLQYYQQGGGATAATVSATAQSFLHSTDPERGRQVFGSAPVVKSRSAAELAAGSRRATEYARLDPIQRVVVAEPRVETAMNNLLQNARNPNIIDFFSKYGTVQPTAKGSGVKTRMTEIG